jgi:hypothetical protein
MPKFRWWLHNLWVDNCEEKNFYGGRKYTLREYWKKYRNWLLTEYRRQRKIEKEKHGLHQRHERWTNRSLL